MALHDIQHSLYTTFLAIIVQYLSVYAFIVYLVYMPKLCAYTRKMLNHAGAFIVYLVYMPKLCAYTRKMLNHAGAFIVYLVYMPKLCAYTRKMLNHAGAANCIWNAHRHAAIRPAGLL